nr:MAG TPA: hypothetical protein [Caudoviricetes sp.]
MKFKKDGKVYDIVGAVYEHCKNTDCLECKLYDRNRNMCVEVSPEQAAILMGYEAIEDDTPAIAEAVEKYGEDVKPAPTWQERMQKEYRELKERYEIHYEKLHKMMAACEEAWRMAVEIMRQHLKNI